MMLTLRLLLSIHFFTSFVSSAVTAAAAINMLNLLMVGNSFTDTNGLEEMVQALLEETATNPVYALRFQHGAANFVEQAADTALQQMMAERHWTWVVLQEQSEIPGFWETDFVQEYNDSMQAATVLNDWTRDQAQAETVLMMTWARRTEDPYNPTIYPDFATMQARVATGYYNMQKQLSTASRQVRIAPAGLAFETVYNQVQATGIMDPTANGTAFSNLYATDGIHPSVAGSYLVACVIYGTLTGRTDILTRLEYTPPNMSAALRQQLQQAAAVTVNQFNQDHAWNRPTSPDANNHSTNGNNKRPYVSPSSSTSASEDNSHSFGVVIMVLVFATGVAFTLVVLNKQRRQRHCQHNQTAQATTTYRGEFPLAQQVELVDLDNNHTGGGTYGEGSML